MRSDSPVRREARGRKGARRAPSRENGGDRRWRIVTAWDREAWRRSWCSSIGCRTLDVVDHEDLERPFRRFETQSELFLKRREDRWRICRIDRLRIRAPAQ